MSRAPVESGITPSNVTVGELKAWFSTEISRIKSDIDTLYDRMNFQGQQGALSSAKVHELDPLVQALRDRVLTLEAQMRAVDAAGDDGIVTALEFSEYKRELDNKFRDHSDALVQRVLENSITPLTKKLEEDRAKLQVLQEKVNGIIIKLAIATSVISFIAGKIIESVAKVYFGH
jgi:hypothetical protein